MRNPFLLTSTAAAVALLVMGALTVYRLNDTEVRAVFRNPGRTDADVRPLASATVDGEGGVGASHAPVTSVLPRAAGQAGRVVRFDFEAGIPESDRSGMLALHARTASGGQVTTIPRGPGLAVRFPAPCARYGSQSCPRAILQSGPADFLNPGVEPFRYGAAIRLAQSETSKGSNVVQKGFADGDSQFKLQVDGGAGRPSCVLVGVSSTRIHLAQAPMSVADGQWHAVECARSGATLTITVDGIIRASSAIPPALSIVNTSPLCVGGKGTSPNNDQFTGSVDDVFVSVGS